MGKGERPATTIRRTVRKSCRDCPLLPPCTSAFAQSLIKLISRNTRLILLILINSTVTTPTSLVSVAYTSNCNCNG